MSKKNRKEAQLALGQHFLQLEMPHTDLQLLISKRAEATQILEQKGLPVYREEHYQRFKIDQELSRPWEKATAPTDMTLKEAKDYACRLTFPDAIQSFIISGKVFAPKVEEDYFIGSIEQFEQDYPGVAERYYHRMESSKRDRITALNTLFTEDVFVFYLPKGKQLEKPIHLIHYPTLGEESGCISFPRMLVIAEEESKGTLLICDHASHDTDAGYVGVIEIYAEAGSEIEYYNIEESDPKALRIFNTHVHQETRSNVLIDNLTIHNGRTRNNYYCDLAGEEAFLNLDGLGILDDEKLLDNWSEIRHSVPNCHSDELFKYTMNDQSVGSFSGLIYVAQDAQKTLAYQNNRNLLLSDTAKMYSKPQLEIYADDVKCSHGMTTGELNEAAIFYLQQRGVPYVEAKLMLTIAFMADVLEKVNLEPLYKRLVTVIENRYRGLPTTCKQ